MCCSIGLKSILSRERDKVWFPSLVAWAFRLFSPYDRQRQRLGDGCDLRGVEKLFCYFRDRRAVFGWSGMNISLATVMVDWDVGSSSPDSARVGFSRMDLAIPNAREIQARVDEAKKGTLGATATIPSIQPLHVSPPPVVFERSHARGPAVVGSSVLFGADLELSTDDKVGWRAVLEDRNHALSKSEVYKVAHHGSPTADAPDLWEQLLCPRPISIVCPFVKGGVILPGDGDLARMRERTDRIFLTSDPTRRARERLDPAVEKTLRESGKVITRMNAGFGHVRLRGKVSSSGTIPEWDIEKAESE